MSNLHVIIIGAGLAGVTVANNISDFANVSVIERGDDSPIKPTPIFLKRKFGENTTYCYAHGGTTNLWHNGLIEIPVSDVPLPFSDIFISLKQYKNKAANELNFIGDFEKEKKDALKEIRKKINEKITLDNIIIPKKTPPLKLNKNKKISFFPNSTNISFDFSEKNVTNVKFKSNGIKKILQADILIICAGGINTPKIIESILKKNNHSNYLIGKNLIDHPMGFLGKIKVKKPYKNLFSVLSHSDQENYSFRTGIKINHKGKSHIFYIRPAITSKNSLPIYKFKSKLGSSTWSQRLKLIFNKKIFHPDILQEIFAQIFNIRIISSHFSFWAVFEQQPNDSYVSVSNNDDNIISWDIADKDITEYKEATRIFLNQISEYIESTDYEEEKLEQYLWSAAHHSGTCSLGYENSPIDNNLKLNEFNNIYVCDGSIIPYHSYANTGLTIAQFSLKLCEHIKNKHRDDK